MALDPLTLRITLKDTSRLFLQKLAATEMSIVSPAHVRAFPDGFNEEPVGTGPFRFKERRKGESVVLERFDRYWGTRPHYPMLQFRIVPEVATRESLLLANQVEAHHPAAAVGSADSAEKCRPEGAADADRAVQLCGDGSDPAGRYAAGY